MDLVDLIERKYLSDGSRLRPFDFAEKMQFFTLDVISALSLSHPFGYVSQDKDLYDYVQTMEDNFPVMNFFSSVPFLSRVMQIPWIQKGALPSVKRSSSLSPLCSPLQVRNWCWQLKDGVQPTRSD